MSFGQENDPQHPSNPNSPTGLDPASTLPSPPAACGWSSTVAAAGRDRPGLVRSGRFVQSVPMTGRIDVAATRATGDETRDARVAALTGDGARQAEYGDYREGRLGFRQLFDA